MSNEIVVLIAEDEVLIRMHIEDALEGGGFAVLAAGNGADAMALLEALHETLVAFVTDIRLGDGPDGWELAARARELNN